MSDICNARIRPFPNDTELRCEKLAEAHDEHRGTLHDYAYPGSKTVMQWHDDDRRNFYGEWPGKCDYQSGCVLHKGHSGRHAP